MKINMPMKTILRFSCALLIAAFAAGILETQFLESALVRAEPSCGEDAFRSCMEGKTSEVNACGQKCPQKEKPCLPGDPPGAKCYGYDESCLNACSSAAEQTCRTKTTCPPPTQPPTQPSSPPATPTAKPDHPSPPSSQQPVTPPVAEVDESFWENTEEVEALVETAPKPITVPSATPKPAINWPEPPEGIPFAVVKEVTGSVQVQLLGRKDWTELSNGSNVWVGSIIQTDFDSSLILDFEGIAVVKVEELTQVAVAEFVKDRPAAKAAMALEARMGDMNLDVNPGSFTADVQIRAGNNTGAVRGTRFGVAYDPETKISVWEIYDGTIKVTNETSGKIVTLTSSYGKPIKRAEISDDGEIALKTAIPKDEWEADRKEDQTETVGDNGGFKSAGALVILAIIVLAGLAFFFFKRRAILK